MGTKVAIAAFAASLAFVGSAQAFQWHLGYGQAKHATKEFAEESCREDRKCSGYAVGPCRRVSNSRVDCVAGLLYKDVAEPGDEVECSIVLHWGVSRGGNLVLKNYGRPDCVQVQ
jgi:hypothetical protein